MTAKESLYAFYRECMAKWEDYKKGTLTFQNRDVVVQHLERGCEVYKKLYEDRYRKPITEALAKASSAETKFGNETLMFIFYDDLRNRFQLDFGQKPLPSGWPIDRYSLHFEKLKYVDGNAAMALILDLYGTLACLHNDGPLPLANLLESYLEQWEKFIHKDFGTEKIGFLKAKMEQLQVGFSCEKLSLLMVLKHWYCEYLRANTPPRTVDIELLAKTDKLPLKPGREVFVRFLLRKNTDLSLQNFEVVVRLEASTEAAIEWVRDEHEEEPAGSALFKQRINSWSAKELPLVKRITLKPDAAIPHELTFSVEVQLKQSGVILTEPQIDPKLCRVSRHAPPINPANRAAVSSNDELQQLLRQRSFDKFFARVFDNVYLDPEAAKDLEQCFVDFEEVSLIDLFCKRLCDIVKENEFPYIGPNEVRETWERCYPRISAIYNKYPLERESHKALKALVKSLTSNDDESVYLSDDLGAVPLSSIVRFYRSDPRDSISLIDALNGLVEKKWCVRENALYKFRNPARFKFAKEHLK